MSMEFEIHFFYSEKKQPCYVLHKTERCVSDFQLFCLWCRLPNLNTKINTSNILKHSSLLVHLSKFFQLFCAFACTHRMSLDEVIPVHTVHLMCFIGSALPAALLNICGSKFNEATYLVL